MFTEVVLSVCMKSGLCIKSWWRIPGVSGARGGWWRIQRGVGARGN